MLVALTKETSRSKLQLAFDRLIKKIEKLQKSIHTAEAELHEGLSYYYSNIRPIEKEMVENAIDCMKVFYTYHTNPQLKLSKQERQVLKDLIISMINRVFMYRLPNEIDQATRSIIEDIQEIDLEKEISEGLASLKEDVVRFGAGQGIHIDLSEISELGSKEELMDKLQRAILEGMKNSSEKREENINSEKAKKKTKLQLKKEQKAEELAELQKKGLSAIYKQLAKAFHPDLEPDPIIKVKKEALMKRLTTAYENQDLHTLLSLEIEWMNYSTSDPTKDSLLADEELKVYNSILKDQSESLKNQLAHLSNNPKYFDIKHIIEMRSGFPIFKALTVEKEELLFEIHKYSSTAKDLREKSGLKTLKRILMEVSTPPDDFFEFIEDLFGPLVNQ